MSYRNIFVEFGYSEEEVNNRLKEIFKTFFYGNEEERIYHEVGSDMGYLVDTGNNDVRTEGMSYGMMMCVQMDMKNEFDRIWKWVKTYMYMSEGRSAGYFAWSCQRDGKKNSHGPAPDGEEFFAAALIFASHRWGDGEGIFNYKEEALALLKAMLHNPETMFDPDTHYIKFITCVDYSDPSYHLPHFYEVYADFIEEWAVKETDENEKRMMLEDANFYREAAVESRKYFDLACDINTGMCAEYAQYDGTPYMGDDLTWGRHDYFYSDAYRTAANMGLDYAWSINKGSKPSLNEKLLTSALRKFWEDKIEVGDEITAGVYNIEGTPVDDYNGKALHPVAIIATNAQSYLATDPDEKDKGEGAYAVKLFYETPLRKGVRRYYDNCLYLFAFLALAGKYRAY